jgi:hypothetical protein
LSRWTSGQYAKESIPDSFRRLYWVVFNWEGDFISEISINLPSGIAKYEELIPYPAFESTTNARGREETEPSDEAKEELVAFQISTNVSIRRFLNRVNSVIFDTKEQSRITEANYVSWLLRTTSDLWTHHSAVYRNVPDFLLTSLPIATNNTTPQQEQQQHVLHEHGSPAELFLPASPESTRRRTELGNYPWNVVRLKGRYFAGQYIIHRPFVEYVLLHMDTIESHPQRGEILDRCRACLEGCGGFIRVFDVEPANNITCLFACGMV